LIAGIGVSFACLYFATRGTDWARVGAILMTARPLWVAGVMLASLLGVYVRAQRWRVLLRPLGVVPLYPALSATAIGFGASAVLPFRIGELVRPALLGRRIGVGVSAALSSVVLERLFDMLLVIACFLIVALVYPLPPALRDSAIVLGVLALVGLAVLYVVQRRRVATETFVERLLARLPSSFAAPLGPLVRSFLGGLGGLADRSTVVLVLAYSIYLWVLIQLTFLFGFLALDVRVPLVAASLATVVIVAGFVFLPQAPGFIGTWQAGCVVALGLFGVPRDEAVGYSLLTWIISMVMNIGAAGVFLAWEDLSPADLLRMRARETPAARAEG